MTVKELINRNVFQVVHAADDLDIPIEKPFCCDLLSIAMGRAPADCAWVTVMGNLNTLAVASLAEAACVILAEDASLDETASIKAKEQQITILKTSLPIFEAAFIIYEMLKVNHESHI